jgi:hypothetical protein
MSHEQSYSFFRNIVMIRQINIQYILIGKTFPIIYEFDSNAMRKI